MTQNSGNMLKAMDTILSLMYGRVYLTTVISDPVGDRWKITIERVTDE